MYDVYYVVYSHIVVTKMTLYSYDFLNSTQLRSFSIKFLLRLNKLEEDSAFF